MQLAAGLVREVHAAHAEAHLEAQAGLVAQGPGHRRQVLAADEQRQLAAVDDDLLDRLGEGGGAADQRALQGVGHLVEYPP